MARERVLAGGGNAVDAAVATLFALTLVEPMMVGIFGAGMTHLRLADGTHMAMDPLQHGARDSVGVLSTGVPGTVKG